ncbi:predicted protein [Naegleria gruberi]|uniref:Predicted protein n=1 Tax=Naegleria gruberi TaxID=5762 RepID=D2VXI1_NAEGR|nr:uncharacterized protein NAEGRDRAFT_73755 [Naegleria gruberi]EFC38512.1 predicted protein [Naegleria gruberi]|eukprot:XP_002671256.1 predicted protein [Naegleria gruberi strain NEG-M]
MNQHLQYAIIKQEETPQHALPNFREFLSQSMCSPSSPSSSSLQNFNNQEFCQVKFEGQQTHQVDNPRFEAISQSSSSLSCDGQHVDLQNDSSIQVSSLIQKIEEMERRIYEQSQVISNLLKENQSLKTRKIGKPTACRKKLTNQSKQMTLVQETSFIENLESGVGDLNQYLVNWRGNQYVIINVFKNRDEIMNYYCPLYQTTFPNKEFKLVVQCDEYKKLFKENQHIKTSEKKQAWRISIFTIDFYNFVKNHIRV